LSKQASLDLVTGAFSDTGGHIAARLLQEGRSVKTLTFHPDRAHPLQASVEAYRYRFDDPAALTRSLEGVSTLYNTFWVRFDHGSTSFANATECSRMLFHAARNAGVERIVHVSIANPSIDSPLPYFRGKALVEYALAGTGVPYSIVRPTWVFGGERDVLPTTSPGYCAACRCSRCPATASTPCSRCTSRTLPGSARRPLASRETRSSTPRGRSAWHSPNSSPACGVPSGHARRSSTCRRR
jgi:hypothetical protein